MGSRLAACGRRGFRGPRIIGNLTPRVKLDFLTPRRIERYHAHRAAIGAAIARGDISKGPAVAGEPGRFERPCGNGAVCIDLAGVPWDEPEGESHECGAAVRIGRLAGSRTVARAGAGGLRCAARHGAGRRGCGRRSGAGRAGRFSAAGARRCRATGSRWPSSPASRAWRRSWPERSRRWWPRRSRRPTFTSCGRRPSRPTCSARSPRRSAARWFRPSTIRAAAKR